MKRLYLFLLLAALVPGFSVAQEQREFDELRLILSGQDYQPYDNVQQGCYWALPFANRELVGGGTMELVALSADGTTGEILEDGATVGELWTCFDGGGDPIEDPSLGPVNEQEILFVVIIGDEVWGAHGNIRPSTPGGFPQPIPGMAVFTARAPLVQVEGEEPAGIIGAISVMLFQDPSGIEGYNDDMLVTLRVFKQRNYAAEAILHAISGGSR